MSNSSCTTEGSPNNYPVGGADSLRECLSQFVSYRLNVSKDRLSPSTSFAEDLGLGFWDVMELIVGIEEHFGVAFNDTEVERMRSVNDVVDYLSRRRSE